MHFNVLFIVTSNAIVVFLILITNKKLISFYAFLTGQKRKYKLLHFKKTFKTKSLKN